MHEQRSRKGESIVSPSSLPFVATHDVANQVAARWRYNVYASDIALREAVAREGAGYADDWLHSRGAELGSAEMLALAEQANRFPPTLTLFDPNGRRRDVVEFHPAYHDVDDLSAAARRGGGSVGRARAGCPCSACGVLRAVCASRGRHVVPDDDDVRQRARAPA